jgi:hypothetical protein
MVNIYSKFQGDSSSSFKVMGQVHILLNTKFKWKKGHNLKNIEIRVMGLAGYDVDFDGEYIF